MFVEVRILCSPSYLRGIAKKNARWQAWGDVTALQGSLKPFGKTRLNERRGHLSISSGCAGDSCIVNHFNSTVKHDILMTSHCSSCLNQMVAQIFPSDLHCRPFVLTRSFFIGSHKYSAIWTGKQHLLFQHWARVQNDFASPTLGDVMGSMLWPCLHLVAEVPHCSCAGDNYAQWSHLKASIAMAGKPISFMAVATEGMDGNGTRGKGSSVSWLPGVAQNRGPEIIPKGLFGIPPLL